MTVEVPRGHSFDAWADEYDRYRPGYPEELFATIQSHLELQEHPHVADLGAGTGRASLAMAALGSRRVTAIEPGRARMLEQLRGRASEDGLVVATVQANAEETGLDPASVDLATAGQAFHWFDKERAVAEMARIVRPGGGVALFWNVRDEDASSFVAAYHGLLEEQFGIADTGRYLQAGRPSGQEATRRAFDGLASFAPLEKIELRHQLAISAEEFNGAGIHCLVHPRIARRRAGALPWRARCPPGAARPRSAAAVQRSLPSRPVDHAKEQRMSAERFDPGSYEAKWRGAGKPTGSIGPTTPTRGRSTTS